MIFKFGFNEFKKSAVMNFAIIIQMALMLVITVAMVTSVVTRFEYYNAYDEYIEKDGRIFMAASITPCTSDEVKENFIAAEDLLFTYSLTNSIEGGCAFAYDDELMQKYAPDMLEGKWVVSDSSKQYAQAMAPKRSGYKVGDIIQYSPVGTDETNYIEIAGIFDDEQKLLWNQGIGSSNLDDFRMIFADIFTTENREMIIDIDSEQVLFMSQSEAEKTSCYLYPFGAGFITFKETANEADKNLDIITLNEMGVQQFAVNSDVEQNSKNYIYGQIREMWPVIVGVAVLLFISLISANSVSTVRRLKNYAIYRVCGLTWHDCGKIAAAKAVFISLSSIILCGIFLVFKSKIPVLKNYLIELGFWQIIAAVIVVALNLAISIFITNTILRKSEPNQLLKSN